MEKKNNFEVVIGIDFGSSGMGYAYSYNDVKNVEFGKIYGSGADSKVPTEIILDNHNGILAYGKGCENYITQNGPEAGHYFKRIKMYLYEKKTKIKAVNSGKEFEIKTVISKILKALKDEALKTIKNARPNIKDNKIKWILTVPAIWDEFGKIIMIDAAEDVGLINENTDISNFLALEPEAASLYCLNDNSLDTNFMKEGQQYIVCDLGGGTGDIVSHKIGKNDNISEITPPSGGNFGSDEIDKYFFKEVIYKLFKIKDFEEIKEKNKYIDEPLDEKDLYKEWFELERQVKLFKESLNERVKNLSYIINFSIFEEYSEDELEKYIEDYNSNSKYGWKINIKNKKKWLLEFPYKIIYDLMNNQAIEISKEIKKITNYEKTIKNIIFVGGYCSSDVMINIMKKNLPKLTHFIPSNPGLSVLKGSVIFGINPYIINIRKAKYTIGEAIRIPWNEKKHSKKGKKIFCEEYKEWECEECFDIFVNINDDIKYNDEISKNYTMVGTRYANLVFYKTMKVNPTFVFEEGVEEIGRCELDAGREYPFGQRDFIVTMKFGGTFLDIKATHEKSGKQIKARFEIEY